METLIDPARMPLPTTLILAADGTVRQVLQAPIDYWQEFESVVAGE